MLGGAILGVNRSLIGSVGKESGSIMASIINHLSGLIFSILLVIVTLDFNSFSKMKDIPYYGYLGGCIGACFVIITSFVIPRIGVLKTSIFFISGQIICGTTIDYFTGKIDSGSKAMIGISLIIVGISLSFLKKRKS